MNKLVDTEAGEEREEERVKEGADGGPASSKEAGSSEDDAPDDYDLEDEFIEKDGAAEEGQAAAGAEAEPRRKKKQKRRRRELVLEEEDYELLEENTGIRRDRPQQQHRRLKRARDVAGADPAGRTAAQLKEDLFGPDEGEEGLEDDLGDAAFAAGPPAGSRRDATTAAALEAGDDLFDEDDDDWIVDEFEEAGDGEGAGAAGAARRRRRRAAARTAIPGVDPAALDEANDIFGDADDLLASYYERKTEREAAAGALGAGAPGGDEYEGVEPDDLSDEEAADELRAHRRAAAAAAATRRLGAALEPDALAAHLLLPRDEEIRAEDVPERQQLRWGPAPAAFDLDECAAWVAARLAGPDAPETKASSILAEGAREVEGPPPEWMGVSRWPEHSMRGGLAETAYQRGFYKGRDSGERRAWRADPGAQAALRASVRAALHLMYERHEEVPLLGMFRKEQLGELLAVRSSDEPARPEHERGGGSGALSAHTRRVRRWDVLYAVQEAAEQWRALARAREARAAAYRRALDAAGSDAERAALGRCVALASAAQSPEALDDAEAAFRVAAPPLEELLEAVAVGGGGAQAGAFKRPQRGAAHQLAAAAAGLEPVLEALGLAPAEFGRSVEAGFRVTEPVDADALPEAVAQALVEPSRPSRRDAPAVLRAARAAAAAALAAEPAVRRAVREAFRRHAVVSTDPTPAGDAALGPFHPLGPAKRLRAKPLRRFEGTDLFLRVLAAEAGGLVTVSLAIPEAAEVGAGAARGAAGLIASLADYGASSAPTPAAEAWNAERAGAVHDAVARRLLPALAAEARARLGAEARAVALQAASDAAWELATAAPLRVALPDEEGQFVAERRFMGACYGPGQPATTFVMLDAAGQMVDFLHCPQLSGVIPKRRAPPGMPYDMFSDPKKSADAARLRDFVEAHLPHAIVVGVAHPEARTLLEDVQGVVNQILTDNPRAFTTSEAGAALVRAADERVPAAWAACAAARAELPAAAGAVRRALALARQALDPLALLASLAAGPPAELASLPLHPLQPWLPQEARAAAVERALCSAAAQVGVDLNALAAAPWAAPTLQFVPGLGPRKAAALLGALGRAGGVLESRAQAWRELGVLGNRVFTNAAPALRVRASSRAAANLELDPLDDMRVHPESYAFAVAMAQSATGGGDAAAAVENALAAPREVVVLQLDAYDRHLRATAAAEAAEAAEEEGEDAAAAAAAAGGTRLATLLDIQAEFVAPYGELRPPGAAPSPQELFWMSLGEDEETLRPGRRLEARVRYVGDELARVVLPDLHGAEGVIRAEDVSARAPHGGQGAMAGLQQPSCREYFKQGDVVAAVVDFVDAEAGEIRLATDSARLNRDWHWEKEYLGKQDPDYQPVTREELAAAERAARAAAARASFVARPIRHPLYRNISMAEAASEVTRTGVAPGAAMVRPAARSVRTLHLTMGTPGGAAWHIEIKEQGKTTSSLQLAPPLHLQPIPSKSYTYDDLDELGARFVDPLAGALRALAHHRKWSPAPGWEAAQAELLEQRKRNKEQVAYCLAAEPLRPGAFYLAYIVTHTPRREFFVALPDGFYFRGKMVGTVDEMLSAFKRNPHYLAHAARAKALEEEAAAAAAARAGAWGGGGGEAQGYDQAQQWQQYAPPPQAYGQQQQYAHAYDQQLGQYDRR